MQLTKNERKELDALSRDVFGISSRWQKMVEKGEKELVTHEVTETVPAEKEGEEPTTRQVRVPLLSERGEQQFVMKRHTVECVKELLSGYKSQLDTIRAQIAAQKEEASAKQRAEEQAKQLHKELSGSAVK